MTEQETGGGSRNPLDTDATSPPAWLPPHGACTLNAALISLASTAALAAAPHAAATSRAHSCAPAEPSFTMLVATPAVRCREARALNTYMIHHETLSQAFTFGGKTWRGTVYSRAHDRTAMVYRHGAERVWITYGGEAS